MTRQATTAPHRRATCAGCGAAIIEPSSGKGKGEGQWVHVELPATVHPAHPATDTVRVAR
jgi:hypothetical protein